MSRILTVLLIPILLVAQKKPVTVEALTRQGFNLGGNNIWSPDGKRFVSQQDGWITVFDVAEKKSRRIMEMKALTQAATAVPAAPAFGWENRRVREQTLQWTDDSKNLIAVAGGDVFLVKLDMGGFVQLTSTPIAERDPKLSPDGKMLAYRQDHDLYVMTIGRGKPVRLTQDGSQNLLNGELDWVYPEELDLGTAYWWSPDSKSLAYMQLDISREMVHPHVDMLGLYAKPEPQRYPKAGTPNADVRLGIVAATGGETRWMDLGEMRDRLLARVYWTPDSSSLMSFRLNRVQNELQILKSSAATGASKVWLEEKDKAWINVKDDFQFLSKRNQVLMGSERDGYRHIYLYDFDGKPIRQITKGEWEVTDVNFVDEGGGRIWFTSTEESPLERHLYSVSVEGGERRKLTKEKGTHSARVSPNGEYWIDTYSSLLEPSRTNLMNAAGNVVSTLREPDRKAQQEYEILPTELHTFKGSDGTLFYSRIIKPKNFDASKKYPVVVMVYGGPHAQTVVDRFAGLSWDQVLAHRGFVIWQMDNHGSAGRGHIWEANINRRFGEQEVAEQVEGVKHLVSLGFVDANRVGIYGWSFGGYMTLMCLLQANDVFKAGISGAPVTDWRHYDTIYTERYMGLPSVNTAGYHDGSPVHYAKNLKGKLMLLHNMGDDNVLYQNNMQMQIELQKAGKQYELLVYPQKAHGVTGPLSRHMQTAMTEFFERTLR